MRPARMFWLDGGGAREWSGRRSLVGLLSVDDVSLVLDGTSGVVSREQHGRTEPVGDDVFDVLAAELARDAGDPDVHWVGYLGYAARRDLPASPARPGRGVPDAVWMRVRRPRFVTHAPLHPTAPAPLPDAPPVPASYSATFSRVQEHLHAGNSYEVNLTYRRRLESEVDPEAAYLRLRAANPAPYAGYLRHHDVHLLSSSPERFASVTLADDGVRRLVARPIKGTTPRSADPREDERLRGHLSQDPKLRAENLMITDLLRHDLAQVCEVGSVDVPELMQVESYATVHQLVTTVTGRLRSDVPTVAALHALFPAGSMTGAPKRRTMEVIEEVEVPEWGPRGVYAGAFGWICADGRADLGVVIRSLVATPADQVAGAPARWAYELGTGGGITVRSDLAEEWAETTWKADRLLAVLR